MIGEMGLRFLGRRVCCRDIRRARRSILHLLIVFRSFDLVLDRRTLRQGRSRGYLLSRGCDLVST